MITFRLGALNTDGRRTGVALRAESSQEAIEQLNKLGFLALRIKSPATKAIEISPGSPAKPAPEKTERFYSDGRRMQRWKLWVSSLPLSFVMGLGFYLLFTGAPQWIASIVMLAGFTFFSLVGFLIEQRRLKAFACPGCQAPIHDWDTNERHHVLFNCAGCSSNWEIEYKQWSTSEPYPSLARRHRLRWRFSEFCMLRGIPIKPVPITFTRAKVSRPVPIWPTAAVPGTQSYDGGMNSPAAQ
jgi:hypothetical protein